MERNFIETLKEWKNENIHTPLMVVGARQVGKTYIIDEFCKNNFNDYVYLVSFNMAASRPTRSRQETRGLLLQPALP